MKYLLSTVLILLSLHFFSQTRNYKVTTISVVSPNMDTLWLVNDITGLSIARSWDMGENTKVERPTIIITDVLPTPIVSVDSKKNKRKRYIRGKK